MSERKPKVRRMPKDSQFIVRANEQTIDAYAAHAKLCGFKNMSAWVRYVLDEDKRAPRVRRVSPEVLAECERHVRFLESTLVPDLRETGMGATADDFDTCVRLIRALLGGGAK